MAVKTIKPFSTASPASPNETRHSYNRDRPKTDTGLASDFDSISECEFEAGERAAASLVNRARRPN